MNLLQNDDRKLRRWPRPVAAVSFGAAVALAAVLGLMGFALGAAARWGLNAAIFALAVLNGYAIGTLHGQLARVLKARETEQQLRAQFRAPRRVGGRSTWFHGRRP